MEGCAWISTKMQEVFASLGLLDGTNRVFRLVSGPVHGKVNQLFNRVNTISATAGKPKAQLHSIFSCPYTSLITGPFDILFCVGKFFDADINEVDAYINGDLQGRLTNISVHCTVCNQSLLVPLPTYVLDKYLKINSTGGDNSDTDDLTLVCPNLHALGGSGYKRLSGLSVAYAHLATPAVVRSLTAGSDGPIDFLFTNQWPTGVDRQAVPSPVHPVALDSPDVAQLASALRPRYHLVPRYAMNNT